LECIQLAFNNRNEIIAIISSSETSAEAQLKLEAHYHINNDQSRVIVDMRFSSLTQQSINAIKDEYNEILEQISQLSQNISLNL
jgi:DNA gyrase/topoisomerase IV subunit A